MARVLSPSVGGGVRQHSRILVLPLAAGLGGAIAGVAFAGIWVASDSLSGAREALIVILGLISLVAQARADWHIWIPQRRRQVRVTRMNRVDLSAVGEWGFELGTGVSTFIVTPTFYMFVAVTIAQGSPGLAVAVFTAYGVARGVAISAYSYYLTRSEASRPSCFRHVESIARVASVAGFGVVLSTMLFN